MARRTTVPRDGVVGGQAPDTSTVRPGHAAWDDTSDPHAAQLGAPAGADDDGRSRRLRRARRSGAGGRWWVWVGRAVLWAFIIVITVNGGRALYLNFTQTSAPVQAVTRDPGQRHFPARAAAAFAQRFANVYLDVSEANAATRARRLAAYVPEGTDPQLGWNGAGRLRLDAAYLAEVDVHDDTNAVVKLAVLVNDQWMRLAVPVYVSDGAMVVSGQPALLPAPPKASLPTGPGAPEIDAEATRELKRQLPGFFKAYAASDTADLDRYLDQGVSLTGLSGTVRFAALGDVVVPPGGTTRKITVTVVWKIPRAEQKSSRGEQQQADEAPAGKLEQTYELTVTKQNGNWYVKDIKGSAVQGGR